MLGIFSSLIAESQPPTSSSLGPRCVLDSLGMAIMDTCAAMAFNFAQRQQ